MSRNAAACSSLSTYPMSSSAAVRTSPYVKPVTCARADRQLWRGSLTKPSCRQLLIAAGDKPIRRATSASETPWRFMWAGLNYRDEESRPDGAPAYRGSNMIELDPNIVQSAGALEVFTQLLCESLRLSKFQGQGAR